MRIRNFVCYWSRELWWLVEDRPGAILCILAIILALASMINALHY